MAGALREGATDMFMGANQVNNILDWFGNPRHGTLGASVTEIFKTSSCSSRFNSLGNAASRSRAWT
jgi:hypothetical protein